MATVRLTLGPKVGSRLSRDGGASIIDLGETFHSDNSWVASPNQKHLLVLQEDGNLVVYGLASKHTHPLKQGMTIDVDPRHDTGTAGNAGDVFRVQKDSNLVIYSITNSKLWASDTAGKNAVGLFVQNDGNVVLYTYCPVFDFGI